MNVGPPVFSQLDQRDGLGANANKRSTAERLRFLARVVCRRATLFLFAATFAATFLFALRAPLFGADGSILWGASNEKTTYSPPYCPLEAPEIPVLTRPETPTANAGTAPDSNAGPTSAAPNPVASDFEAKLRETGTVVGPDGKTYRYFYTRGVQPFRVVETRRVCETPPGGLFPVCTEKTSERIVWRPTLIKTLCPLNAAAPAPTPCRSAEISRAL